MSVTLNFVESFFLKKKIFEFFETFAPFQKKNLHVFFSENLFPQQWQRKGDTKC